MAGFGQLEERVRRQILELEAAGLRRKLKEPSGIDLSSNDYLGLSSHPLMKQRMAEAVMEQGCGSTGSRLLRGHRETLAEAERQFANFKTFESSLYFGSGYAANIGVLSTFIERHDTVFVDSQNHASLVDGVRLSRARRVKFRHCDVDDLAHKLRRAPAGVQKFVVTESLFSMDGDFALLDRYAELCSQSGAALIVDEAHAVGIYGQRGSGWVEQTGSRPGVFLAVDPAGKALGVSGAFVSGPEWAIDFLIQRARTFMFSTAPVPAVAAALQTSLSLITGEPDRRRRVIELAGKLRSLLKVEGCDIGLSGSQIIPVILGDNERASFVARALQEEGFDVRVIRPPTVPQGTARLRVSVNAGLRETDLRRFAKSLGRVASCSVASS